MEEDEDERLNITLSYESFCASPHPFVSMAVPHLPGTVPLRQLPSLRNLTKNAGTFDMLLRLAPLRQDRLQQKMVTEITTRQWVLTTWQTPCWALPCTVWALKTPAGPNIFLIFSWGNRSSEKEKDLSTMAGLPRDRVGLEPRVSSEGHVLLVTAHPWKKRGPKVHTEIYCNP